MTKIDDNNSLGLKGKDAVATMQPLSRFISLVMTAVLVFGLAGCGGGGGGATGSTAPTVSLGGTGTATQLGGSTVTPTTNQPGQINGNVAASTVGTQVCGQCHASSPFTNSYVAGMATDTNATSPTYMDVYGYGSIYNNYIASVHYTPAGSGQSDYVGCEGCHGPGSQHYGVGPIPFYAPSVAQCETCHSGSGPSIATQAVINSALFGQTRHANAASTPDKFFFQGSTGTEQATYFSQPEWQDVAGTVPVTKNQHIQECSACHSPDTKATHIQNGDVPDPPQVGCANCHDAHSPADKVRNYLGATSATEVDPSQVENLKPYPVNNNSLGVQFGAMNFAGGTWIRPRNWYAYHVGGNANNTYSGYANQGTVGDWLRLSSERLCAACHTPGQYLYGKRAGSTNITQTHQTDVFTQYKRSLHASFNDAPWQEFSLLATTPDHRPQYPVDMGGKPGQNGTTVPFDGNINGGANNFQCNQCHHGIGTIDYINGVQGGTALGDSNQAHVLWGDQTATCITCHDPHKNGTGNSKNVRTPKWLSYNPEFTPPNTPTGTGNARGGVNTFLDLTPIPAGIGNNVMCMFCHQGRESGWTAWNKVRRNRLGQGDTAQAASDFWYAQPNSVIKGGTGFSYVNDHYLAAGALIYGRNSTEYVGNFYSDGIPKHIEKNCTGCHMAPVNAAVSQGGHTMVPQVTTCQTCHAGVTTFHDILATGDWNGNGVKQTVYDELGQLATIPAGTAAPTYGTGVGGTGLFGLMNEALWDLGIEYDPNTYPYFYKAGLAHTAANAFKAWTPNTLAAAQNLQQFFKTGSPNQQAVYVHNPMYPAQILIDGLITLNHTTGATGVNPFARPTSAAGGTTHAGRDYRTLNVP